ncbi:hypothetical protein VNO77_20514 [Canavalia gladiata]|uniref:Uncharacterized protein n=1 Tax=Canavalia gladiata TaxID=3824 RepID=A0AAN9QQM6_CANGL
MDQTWLVALFRHAPGALLGLVEDGTKSLLKSDLSPSLLIEESVGFLLYSGCMEWLLASRLLHLGGGAPLGDPRSGQEAASIPLEIRSPYSEGGEEFQKQEEGRQLVVLEGSISPYISWAFIQGLSSLQREEDTRSQRSAPSRYRLDIFLVLVFLKIVTKKSYLKEAIHLSVILGVTLIHVFWSCSSEAETILQNICYFPCMMDDNVLDHPTHPGYTSVTQSQRHLEEFDHVFTSCEAHSELNDQVAGWLQEVDVQRPASTNIVYSSLGRI